MLRAAVVMTILAVTFGGCGSGETSIGGRSGPVRPARETSPGVGMRAPVTDVVVARRFKASKGRPPGEEAVGSKGCVKEDGDGEIGIYTDTPEPSCVQVTGAQPVLIVNRTGAYHRSEGKSLLVRLGPYRARLLPQQAARFGPVGRFLGRGLHDVIIGRGRRLGVLIEPANCGIFRARPGEPLCFEKERVGRLRRWRRAVARRDAPPCRGSALVVSIDRRTEDAAGTIYRKLDVLNRSRHSCNVAGVPLVTAVDRDGKRVATAEPVPLLRPHSRRGHRRTWLRGGGGGVSFTVTHSDRSRSGRCRLARASGLRVMMPGADRPRIVGLPISYCASPRGALGLRVGRIE